VTFLIPVFAVLWGSLFLQETLSATMIAGCAVVLLGTSLATGFWSIRAWRERAGAAQPGPGFSARAGRSPR